MRLISRSSLINDRMVEGPKKPKLINDRIVKDYEILPSHRHQIDEVSEVVRKINDRVWMRSRKLAFLINDRIVKA